MLGDIYTAYYTFVTYDIYTLELYDTLNIILSIPFLPQNIFH